MAAFTSPTPLERLANERDALVAWLASEFAQALSVEDAEDLVADALPALAADPRLPSNGRRRRTYLRQALRRDAIDELRRRHGRDLRGGPRALVPIEDAGEVVDPTVPPGHDLEEARDIELRHAAVERTMSRLSPRDADLLRLRYLEELAPSEVAAELGLSRTQYERRLSEAGAHGLTALTQAESGPACGPVRQLLRAGRLKTRDDIARVDVHLLDCLHCRAFAARARGLLEFAGLPVVATCERVVAKVATLFGRAGEGAVSEAHNAALAGGAAASAGTALSVGIGSKVVISCTGALIAAVCAAPIVHELAEHPKPTARAAAATTKPKRASAKHASPEPTPRATATVVAIVPTATVTATPTRTPTATKKTTPRRLTRSERKQRNRVAAAREFGADGATPDVSHSSGATASISSTGGTTSVPPPPPPPEPAAASTKPKSSSFTGEFRP